MVFDRANRLTIGPAAGEEEDKESGNQRLIERTQFAMDRAIRDTLASLCQTGSFVNERSARCENHNRPKRDHAKRRKPCIAKAFASILRRSFGDRLVFGLSACFCAARPRAKLGLDHFVRHVPDDRQVEERHCRDKVPVARKVRAPCRVECARAYGLFRDPEKQRIELSGGDVRRETARDARKGRCNPCKRVSACRGKEYASQRDQDHIARIGSVVSDHGDQRDNGCEQANRSAADRARHTSGKETGTLSNACAQHHHKDISQRVEVGEGLGHFDPELLDIVGSQKTDRADHNRIASLINLRGVFSRNANRRQDNRNRNQREDQIEKQENRIGQFVATAFNPAKKAGHALVCVRLGSRCHMCDPR